MISSIYFDTKSKINAIITANRRHKMIFRKYTKYHRTFVKRTVDFIQQKNNRHVVNGLVKLNVMFEASKNKLKHCNCVKLMKKTRQCHVLFTTQKIPEYFQCIATPIKSVNFSVRRKLRGSTIMIETE